MKNFPGTPGTFTGLVLRISQCVFSVGSISSMATTRSFFNFTAFWYLPPAELSILLFIELIFLLFSFVQYLVHRYHGSASSDLDQDVIF